MTSAGWELVSAVRIKHDGCYVGTVTHEPSDEDEKHDSLAPVLPAACMHDPWKLGN